MVLLFSGGYGDRIYLRLEADACHLGVRSATRYLRGMDDHGKGLTSRIIFSRIYPLSTFPGAIKIFFSKS